MILRRNRKNDACKLRVSGHTTIVKTPRSFDLVFNGCFSLLHHAVKATATGIIRPAAKVIKIDDATLCDVGAASYAG